jgi:hypothetical protein
MWPFVSFLQCQVVLVFSLKIVYGEPMPNLFPHHVVPSLFRIETIFKFVGFLVIPPLKHLIKPTRCVSIIDGYNNLHAL